MPSVIGLMCLVFRHIGADDLSNESQLQVCADGYCLPKHLCPTGRIEEDNDDGSRLLTLDVEQENECDDFMKICCIGASKDYPKAGFGFMASVSSVEHKCGVSNPGGLVYNVTSNLTYAGYAEFPWTVAIFKSDYKKNDLILVHVGGGSLIHPKFVLTAAHIVYKPERYIARLGEWNMRSEAEIYSSQDIGVEERIKHPNYLDTCMPNNDIALLVLKRSVIYTEHIRPICLPSPQDVFDGQRCIATGWGVDIRTNEPADIMKRTELPVVPKARCQLLYRVADSDDSFRLHQSAMCAGGEVGADTCSKDGGSPLACSREDESYVLAGIVSWGLECGRIDAPGVYVDVAKFACWINDTIEGYEELHGI